MANGSPERHKHVEASRLIVLRLMASGLRLSCVCYIMLQSNLPGLGNTYLNVLRLHRLHSHALPTCHPPVAHLQHPDVHPQIDSSLWVLFQLSVRESNGAILLIRALCYANQDTLISSCILLVSLLVLPPPTMLP